MPNTTDQQFEENFSQQNKIDPQIPEINGLQTEYAHSNRWIGYIPLANVLGGKYKNLEINLVRFTIPHMEMGSTQTSFKGYTAFMPTKVMDPSSKEITFEYIVDERWNNYRSLYAWMSGIQGNINQVDKELEKNNLQMSNLIDVRVWLIDSFKNRILDLCFYNSWIHTFQDMTLESAQTDEVRHSFTMYYSNFEIKNALE